MELKEYTFISNVECDESGFFDAHTIEAKSIKDAWAGIREMLTEEEFKTAEML